MWRPSYVPASYEPTSLGPATLWSAGPERRVQRWVEDALARVQACLSYRPSRALHVVVYASARDAQGALDRTLPTTTLLAPLHQPDHALVALHAPQTAPANQDPRRMRRHLCHELAHVCTAEVTGSLKRLGDQDAQMKVEPWVDEGIAQCVAAVAADQLDVLERAAAHSSGRMSRDEMNAAFRDLNSPHRSAAFAQATMAIWRAAQRHTLPVVFLQAAHPSAWWVP
jgi:hypothetical protein